MKDFNNTIPIYIQVMDDIKRKIALGVYLPNDRVESVRELAIFYGANPNTIQRALSELEREGLLRAERTIGRFICDNSELIASCKKKLAEDAVTNFLQELTSIGLSLEEGIELIKERKGNHE